ncbi:MAG: tRNA-intron lyase [Candidatus Diapherotrites archaeon]|nr:tRNA-intron lyase [Candidatus Diapherotrites archaeon]
MNLLTGSKVLISDNDTKSRLVERGFGEKKDSYLVLSLHEALYLLEKGKFEVHTAEGKELNFEELAKVGAKEKNFHTKYIVFKDLRDRGFVTRTGFKFGFDFRVYPRGKKPGEEHTEWVIQVKGQETSQSWAEFSRIVRMSGNLKTKFLQAVVDSEDDVNYYQVERIVP